MHCGDTSGWDGCDDPIDGGVDAASCSGVGSRWKRD